MKVTVKPLDEGLQRGVDKLRTLIYPDHPEAGDVEWHSTIWSWLYTHPLASETHRWVLVNEKDEVVGHLAAIPQFYRIRDQRTVAHTPGDYMVLPGHGFHALSLMRKFFRTVENCVTCDHVEEAIGVETRMGAEKAATLHHAVKVLDVSAIPRLPEPAKIALRLPSRMLGAADKALCRVFGGDSKTEIIEEFDSSFDEFFEEVASARPCVPEKDAAFLRWRYGPESPQSPVTVLGVREGEKLLGYAVLRVTVDGGNGYIMDLTTLPQRGNVARALLRDAVRHFMRIGAYIVRYRFLESPTAPNPGDLKRMGFFFRKARRHKLLVKFSEQSLHETATGAGNWSYSAGDGEMTFWVR